MTPLAAIATLAILLAWAASLAWALSGRDLACGRRRRRIRIRARSSSRSSPASPSYTPSRARAANPWVEAIAHSAGGFAVAGVELDLPAEGGESADRPREAIAAAENAFTEAGSPGADSGWQTVLRVGRYPHPQRRGEFQAVTPEDLARIVANAGRVRGSVGEAQWAGFPWFAGHPEDLASAPAVGWAKNYRIEGQELQVRTLWNSDGQTALAERRYKAVSPSLPSVRDAAGDWRPFWIEHLGLTNFPNMRDLPLVVNSQSPVGSPAPEPTPAAPPPPTGLAPVEAGSGEPASPTPVAPPPPAHAAPEGSAWWMLFTGRLAAIVEGAASAEDAVRRLSAAMDELYSRAADMERMRSLVGRLCGIAGREPAIAMADPEALATTLANAVADSARAAALETELAERVLADAVARGAVPDTDEARAAARALIAADRSAAETLFNSSAAARRAPAPPEVPFPPAGPRALRTPPPDPLAGPHAAALRHAAGGLRAPSGAGGGISDQDAQAIVHAARSLQEQDRLPWEAAHAQAWDLYRAGKLGAAAAGRRPPPGA